MSNLQGSINTKINLNGELFKMGTKGYSAYEVAVQQGFKGTVDEWLASLVGPQGIEGPVGPSGSNGENGATFTPSVSEDGTISWSNDKGLNNPESVNIKGPKGDTGLQGPQGEPGQAGTNGRDGVSVTSMIQTTTSSESSGTNVITTTFSDGSTSTFNILNGDKGDKGDQGLQGIQGPKGDTGETGPQGVTGANGQSATITIGTVTTLEAGSNATVENVGTNTDAIFNFGIPKGVDGTGGSSVSPLNGKKIAFVGDSITAGYLANTNYPTILATKTGAIVQNLGLTGATITDGDDDCDFIATGVNVNEDSDYILIMGGGNDFFLQRPIGTNNDTVWTTLKGALKQIITYYQANIPNAKLFVATDTPFVIDGTNDIQPYWNAMQEICAIYHIPFLNLWDNFGLNPQISQVANIYYKEDLTHLTDSGQEYLANKVQKFLENEIISSNQNAISLNGYKLSILTASEYSSLSTKDPKTIYITKDQKAYLGSLQILGGEGSSSGGSGSGSGSESGGGDNTGSETALFNTANKVYEESITSYEALSYNSFRASANATSPAYVTFAVNGLKNNTNYQLTYDVVNTNASWRKWYFITDSTDSGVLLNSDDGPTFNTGTNTTIHARIALLDGGNVTENTCTFTNIEIKEVV